MGDCGYHELVMRYHDGELTPAQRGRFADHVADCPDCRLELARLRATSKLLAAADAPAVPPGMLARLHREVGSVRDLTIIRICRPLALAAAAVLVVCLLWLWQTGSGEAPQAGRPSAWEVAALTPATEAADTDSDDFIALWMVDGLSEVNGQ